MVLSGRITGNEYEDKNHGGQDTERKGVRFHSCYNEFDLDGDGVLFNKLIPSSAMFY